MSGADQGYGTPGEAATAPIPLNQPRPAEEQAPAYGPFHNTPTSGAGTYPTSGAGTYPTSGAGGYPTSGAGAYPTSGAGAGEVDQYGLPVTGTADRFGPPASNSGPISASPISAGPIGGSPISASPITGGPISAGPVSGSPVSGGPITGGPISGGPISGGPVSGGPGGFGVTPADQYGLAPTSGDRFGGYSGPRIEPTPKQPKGRFLIPALAGLVAGLLVFGTGGWFLGRATAPDDGTPAVAAPAPSAAPSASAGAYEQHQISINQPKFTGGLSTIGQGWLARLSSCSRNGDKGGPTLNKGEKTRVRCEMDAMSVIFVEYSSTAERDKARATTEKQNIDARELTPGVGATAQRPAPSGRSNGNYVEYAYKVSGRTVAGIWWDDAATPVAGYVLAYWKEGIGQKWDPLREVWADYA
ncbi:hypothetical protein [Actinoplanes sp. N902-109]|uniref:hypothetical protein n=1 Tax=Actinoplanes sp. (strain N902-109) TaxID=649831 RepID=UPI000329349D|nr:hypothetical protein [Actinoplanes sp. N902-109]AGL20266.1 hypothetical protein L083_6756 [Actinoplanes sp. N902-109]